MPGRKCRVLKTQGVSLKSIDKANPSCPKCQGKLRWFSNWSPAGQQWANLQDSFPEVCRALRQDWGVLIPVV